MGRTTLGTGGAEAAIGTKRRVATAALAGAAGVGGSYAVAGYTPDFVVAPIDALVVALAPGWAMTWAIRTLGDAGHLLGLLLAVLLTIGLFAAVTSESLRLGERLGSPPVGALVAAASVAVMAMVLTGAPAPALAAAIADGLVAALGAVGRPTADGESVSRGRRRVVRAAAGVFTLGLLGSYLARSRSRSGDVEPLPSGSTGGDGASGEGTTGGSDPGASALFDEAEAKSLDVPGIPGLVSGFEEFYEVDINSINPDVDAADWTLRVTGAVEEELSFTYDDLRSRPAEHRFTTLRCVGEPLNGRKMDNAVWTGVPVADLFEEAGLRFDECCVMLHADDGYSVGFPLAALENAFLAYGMNGEPLPRGHGHPVRALVPGHWGETNVKWITGIEVLDEPAKGYWEKRGWHGTGPVNTVAKLWTVNRLGDGRVQVGGHAYAGTRGVERVEVSVDGGQTWTHATLSEPLSGTDVWRQWEHTYEASGRHEVVVRATDGEGDLQPADRADAYPSGATGWVRKTVKP